MSSMSTLKVNKIQVFFIIQETVSIIFLQVYKDISMTTTIVELDMFPLITKN